MPISTTQISKTIQDITPMMVLSIDKNTQFIVFSNSRFTEVTGYESGDLLDTNVFSYIKSDGFIRFADALELLKNTKQSATEFEVTLLDSSGAEIDSVLYLRLHERFPDIIYLFFTDNRKQKAKNEKLEVYRQIFSSTNDMMAIINTDLKYQIVNQAYLDHFGVTEQEILNTYVKDMHGDNSDFIIERIEHTLKTGKKVRIQPKIKDVLSKTGTQYVDVLYAPFYDEEQNIVGVIVYAKNITSFKNQEFEIKKRMHYYESLFQHSPDLLASINLKNGVIIECNQTLERILGYDVGEVNGKHIFEFHSQIHNADLANAIAQLKLGKMITGLELSLVTKNNEIIDAHLRTTPLIDIGDDVAIFVWRDVRHQKKLAYKASHDPLTRLLNRSGFLEELEKPFAEHTLKVLCYIDIDNFKTLNDRFGHLKGDEFLIELSKIFKSNIRKNDHVGRIGGDEFVILIYDSEISVVEKIMLSILDEIKELTQSSSEYEKLDLGASIGIAELYPDEPTKLGMQRADDACYESKRKGKNRISVFEAKPKKSKLELLRISDITAPL